MALSGFGNREAIQIFDETATFEDGSDFLRNDHSTYHRRVFVVEKLDGIFDCVASKYGIAVNRYVFTVSEHAVHSHSSTLDAVLVEFQIELVVLVRVRGLKIFVGFCAS